MVDTIPLTLRHPFQELKIYARILLNEVITHRHYVSYQTSEEDYNDVENDDDVDDDFDDDDAEKDEITKQKYTVIYRI